MAGSKEFMDEYGRKSFAEFPFCDGDVISICEATYMPFEKVVSPSFDDEPVSLESACDRLFALNGYEHKKLGLMITNAPSVRMMQMADSVRYEGVKMVAFRAVYSFNPAIQFAAGTLILPDGTLAIFFRGTDDTVAGWKEDLDLLLHKGTPAYKFALDYIEEAAEKLEGDIILMGHSKGGNEALHTALKCSEKVRSRIKALYNNDGPGFFDHSIFKTGTYDEIADRYKHYIPSSAFIGALMAHDYDYKAVKSTKHLGPFQHDIGTWKIENGELLTAGDTDALSKVTDVLFAKISAKTLSGFAEDVDTVVTEVLAGAGQETLTDFAKNIVPSIKGAKAALDMVKPEIRQNAKQALKGTGKMLKESIEAVKNGNAAETAKQAFSQIGEAAGNVIVNAAKAVLS